jgi:hypothetical protein
MRITTPLESGGYCMGPLKVAIPIATEETMATNRNWDEEDSWWRNNFSSRPYATGRNYDEFRPAYQYGYESGLHHMGRQWNDVESDLQTGWEKFEGRRGAGSTWDSVKHAIRDAWHRVTGQDDLDTDRMSEAEYDRVSQGGRTR